MSPRFRRNLATAAASTVSPASELGEVFFAVGFRHLLRLVGLKQHMVAEDQDVHVGHQETAVGVFRCADDRLAADIEACVDQHRAAGLFMELRQQAIEQWIAGGVDGLTALRSRRA